MTKSIRILIAVCILVGLALPAHGQDTEWFLHPFPVTAGVPFQVIGSGIWPDGCVPTVSSVEYDGDVIRIDTEPASDLCVDQLQVFVAPAAIRPLLEGSYDVDVWFTDVYFGGAPELLTHLDLDVQPAVTEIALGDEDRFRVEVDWATDPGTSGAGVPTLASRDSALFWFFAPENWELMVKVLDGCGVNGHHWVFLAASTNVEYTVRVTDTATGEPWTFTNPQGRRSPAVTDTAAFACAP